MITFFTEILNLSVTASFLILAVFVLRIILKKAPKGVRYILWAMVGLRLAIPFSFESRLSILPNAQSFDAGVDTSTTYVRVAQTATADKMSTSEIIAYIWLSGVAIMLLYMLVSFVRVRLMVREAVLYKDNIYMCDHVHSPFVLGIVNPKIYLSSSMSKREMNLVINHERTHIKHGDHLWKPLGFLLLSVYWFNPLCFIAYFLFVKDIELFCDESVTKTLSRTARKKYSYALLGFSKRRMTVSACPLAFAENDVKTRVKNVLSYKKPAIFVIVASVVVCIMTMVLFMSSPVSAKIVAEYKFSKNLNQVVEQVEEIAPTEPPTEPPTEKPTEKPKKKAEKKTEEPQQEYYDNSYEYSGNYSQELYEVVPFSEIYKQRVESGYYDAPWAEKPKQNTNKNTGAKKYYEIQPGENEIVWDMSSVDVSQFN